MCALKGSNRRTDEHKKIEIDIPNEKQMSKVEITKLNVMCKLVKISEIEDPNRMLRVGCGG